MKINLLLGCNNVILGQRFRETLSHSHQCSSAVTNLLCVWPCSRKWYVTRDPTVETAVASDIYRKLINTNTFSW